ncbi:MAG: hypothetical protein ACJ72Z_09455 [Pyrinomonadaceae bacterium]
MIDLGSIDAIIEQYSKHGWSLRRILVGKVPADEFRDRFPDAPVLRSGLDALWFSRVNRDKEAWELRRLDGPPFALVQVFDKETPDEVREAALKSVEIRMAEASPNLDSEILSEK